MPGLLSHFFCPIISWVHRRAALIRRGNPGTIRYLIRYLYFVTKNGNNCDTEQAGAGRPFFQQRMDKLTEEFDGLRLDHPHGLICPWVYKAGTDDPFVAVQNGARLFSSPLVTEHPALIKYALVRPDQLNTKIPRYEEGWVADLDDEQVHRYGRLFDVVMQTAREKWSGLDTIACEVLSTQPYPMKRIMQLYGMGRFRVTQKVDLDNKFDVYRSENAQPEDWLMLGNHDTPSIRQVAERWFEERTSERHAKYLAERLRIPEEKRTGWIERLSIDTDALVQAKFAELFVGPAQNVMVFFTDLLGNIETYNQPGLVSKENWTLRVPRDYQKSYKLNLMNNLALNIPKALAAALRAKGATTIADN